MRYFKLCAIKSIGFSVSPHFRWRLSNSKVTMALKRCFVDMFLPSQNQPLYDCSRMSMILHIIIISNFKMNLRKIMDSFPATTKHKCLRFSLCSWWETFETSLDENLFRASHIHPGHGDFDSLTRTHKKLAPESHFPHYECESAERLLLLFSFQISVGAWHLVFRCLLHHTFMLFIVFLSLKSAGK